MHFQTRFMDECSIYLFIRLFIIHGAKRQHNEGIEQHKRQDEYEGKERES